MPATADERRETLGLLAELFEIAPRLNSEFLLGDALFDASKEFCQELVFKWWLHPVFPPNGAYARNLPWVESNETRPGKLGVPYCANGVMKLRAADVWGPERCRAAGLHRGQSCAHLGHNGPLSSRLRWVCENGVCKPQTTRLKDDARVYTYVPRAGKHKLAHLHTNAERRLSTQPSPSALTRSPFTTGSRPMSGCGRSALSCWTAFWKTSRRSKAMAMATSGTAKVTLSADDQILIEREFAAPAHLVWRAVTEPELVRRWWHAGRGEMTGCEIDLRVGGSWRYAMRPENAEEFAFYGEFLEIVPNEKIVQTETFAPFPEDASTNTMTLTERGGVTLLRTLVQHQTAQARDMHINSGMEAGMQDAFDLIEQVAISLA